MKRERKLPKPGFCLLSAVVWALMAVVWAHEAAVWQNACRLELVEASGVWLRWGLAAVSAGLCRRVVRLLDQRTETGLLIPPGLRRKKTENLNRRRNIQWLTRKA